MEFRTFFTDVREVWFRGFCLCKHVLGGGTFCQKYNCRYSQILRRRQQWKNCEITGGPRPIDAV